MTDVNSVVSVLKNTPKGKLTYSSSLLDNTVSPSLQVLPAIIEPYLSSKVSEKIFATDRKTLNEFHEEQSIEARNSVVNESPHQYKTNSDTKKSILSNKHSGVHVEKSILSNKHSGVHIEESILANKHSGVRVEKSILSNKHSGIHIEENYHYSTKLVEKKIQEQYKEPLVKKTKDRVEKMKLKMKEIHQDYEECLENIERNLEMKLDYEITLLIAEESELNQLSSQEMQKFQHMKMQRDLMVQKKRKQAEEEQTKIQLALKRKEEINRKIKDQKIELFKFVDPAQEIKNQIVSLFLEYKDTGNLPQNITILYGQVCKFYTQLFETINEGVNGDGKGLDIKLKQASELLSTLEKLLKACENEKVKTQLENESEKKRNKEKVAEVVVTPVSNASPTIPTSKAQNNSEQPVAQSSIVNNKDNINLDFPPELVNIKPIILQNISYFSDALAFEGYLRFKRLLLQVEKQCEPLDKSTIKEKKSYKFDLYKVVNTTINAISDESSKHLLGKLLKLFELLTEQSVEVGNKAVDTKSDPNALLLCKNLLAKKLVLQGATQIASNYHTAFPIAVVAVGIWTLFPDCGQLILAHFYNNCPYLVPFYIPFTKNMDPLEYHKLIGYDVDAGKVEDEDKFLRKISGIVRLYAAIVQTDVPPHLGDRPHPHGLEYAWVWFTRFLSLEPRPSVSAVIVYDFLEVAGHAMMKRFGKQFQKLLLILCESYMPKVTKVTPNEGKPAVMRLEMFLEVCIKEGKIKEPEGLLSKQWWNRH